MRLIGIDYGEKRIGLALSDESEMMAFPHIVVSAGENAVKIISKICEEMKVDKIVIGQSLDFSMKENPIMKEVKVFANSLSEVSGLPVEFHQEFLSSHQAQKERFEAGKESRSRKIQKRNVNLDASAATIILQSYLDKKVVNS